MLPLGRANRGSSRAPRSTRSLCRIPVTALMAYRTTYRQGRGPGKWPTVAQTVRPAIWLVSRPFVWLYRLANLLFKLDERGAASNLKRLTKEVESDCDYLFSKYGGRIVPELSSGSPYMDFATVVIEVRSLQLRAIRDRGFTSWEITPSNSRGPWQSLELVCRNFAPKEGFPPSTFHLLVDHLPEIEQLLAREHGLPSMLPYPLAPTETPSAH